MKVILLDNVKNVGRKNEVVEVKDGYGLNFLIPQGLARHASVSALKELEIQQEQVQAGKEASIEETKKVLKELESVQVAAAANEQGHLFAKVGKDTLANALSSNAGVVVLEKDIELEKPLAEVGEYDVEVRVGEERVIVKVVIAAE